jgi:hypothetical protein
MTQKVFHYIIFLKDSHKNVILIVFEIIFKKFKALQKKIVNIGDMVF